MRISVIIPVYNVEMYITDCLRSVVSQTWDGDIECIIVDDCTTDSSWSQVTSFVDSYKGQVNFVLLRHRQNRGLSATRNTGIDASTGDYIMFLDSDDTLVPDALERYSKPLVDHDYDMVIASTVFQDNPEVRFMMKECKVNGRTEMFRRFCDATVSYEMQSGWFFSVWNKLYRAEFIRNNQIRFVEGLIYEDVPWTFIVMSEAESVYVLPNPVVIYNVRPDSIMTGTSSEKYIINSINGLAVINDYCVSKGIPESVDKWRFILSRNENILHRLIRLDTSRKSLFRVFLSNNQLRIGYGIGHRIVPVTFLMTHLYYCLPMPLSYYYWRLYNRVGTLLFG